MTRSSWSTRRGLCAEREPLLDMHPDDATSRGIADGEQVRVWNDRGAVLVRARVGDRVRAGVVSMPSGWWATLSPGRSSANALTADGLSDHGEGGHFHDALVQVASHPDTQSEATSQEQERGIVTLARG